MAEDEAAWEDSSMTFMEVPNDLVPVVRELLAKRAEKLATQKNRNDTTKA
jgi:hypothetical protein